MSCISPSLDLNLAAADMNKNSDFRDMESLCGRKTSKYRGVNRIREKETYVAFVYGKESKPKQSRTVYLGRFDKEEDAAKAHDLVSLKFWGSSAKLNFPRDHYAKATRTMARMSNQEVLNSIRRSSYSLARSQSRFRGVLRHSCRGKKGSSGRDCSVESHDLEQKAASVSDPVRREQKGKDKVTSYDLSCQGVDGVLNANKVKDGMEVETDPLSSETGSSLTEYRTNGNPTVPHPSSGDKQENIPSEHFPAWFLEIIRKEKTSALGSSFRHGDFSVFKPYKGMQEWKQQQVRPSFRFKHAYLGAYQSSRRRESSGESSHVPQTEVRSSLMHYQINLAREQWMRNHRFGFKHASSSYFRH